MSSELSAKEVQPTVIEQTDIRRILKGENMKNVYMENMDGTVTRAAQTTAQIML